MKNQMSRTDRTSLIDMRYHSWQLWWRSTHQGLLSDKHAAKGATFGGFQDPAQRIKSDLLSPIGRIDPGKGTSRELEP